MSNNIIVSNTPISSLVSSNVISTTSGTNISFTGFPSTVKRISITFRDVSISVNGWIWIQIGSSGIPLTTGYKSIETGIDGGTVPSNSTLTSAIYQLTKTATGTASGAINLYNLTGNVWIASGSMYRSGEGVQSISTGTVTLSNKLDIIQISAVGGGSFNGGQINVMYDPVNTTVSNSSNQIQNISVSVGSNALNVSYAGGYLDFRSSSLTSGIPYINIPIGYTLITIPSGATLGTSNGISARLIVLVAYNNNSPVLCITNLAGGLQLDETNLISPTTISSGSTVNNIIYSASTVSANSPYRIVGFIDITETTAGTWATAPTLVQGTGGIASTVIITSGIAAGTIIAFSGSSVPSGYLQCPTTVTNVSRTTYAVLFAAIGTSWGSGDGSTTFGIPYFATGYVPVVGTVGVATVGQNLAHTHTYTTGKTLGGTTMSLYGSAATASPVTNSSGGAANLAAGMGVMYCVKY